METRHLQATVVRRRLLEWLREPSGDRLYFEEGGTRSGKTKNLCIGWAQFLHLNPGALLSITRETGPALSATVRRDMIETLRECGLYDDRLHNKTHDLITLPGHTEPSIEFFATDDKQKVHGRKRHYLWANEANELDEDTFTQLDVRTSVGVCFDFNPSMREDHWIWKRYDDATNVRRYRSTYLDNPFLSVAQIKAIEALKDQDEFAWQVYGLGLRGVPADAIFQGVQPLPAWPDGVDYVYGLDFGYNDPMSLCRVGRRDAEGAPMLYVWSLVHESFLTTADLIGRMEAAGVERNIPIYCDSAEPDRIEELCRAGFYALPADKRPGSVAAGIDYLKRHTVHVGGEGEAAVRARNEWKAYRWKKVRGVIQDAPAHDDSHAPDAGRYAAFTHYAPGPSWLVALPT